MIVADQCAIFVNEVFGSHAEYSGLTLLFAAILFAIQIYCDFSGYSDIAIGTARLFGFNLTQNFAFPLFSRDIAEFWRRWHITLFNWCKDYIYIPLGGSRKGKGRQLLYVLIAYGTLGFWHGANFTFVLFGFLHGFAYMFLVLIKAPKKVGIIGQGQLLPSFREILQMLVTFVFFFTTLIIFRSDSIQDAFLFYQNMFSADLFKLPAEIPRKSLLLAVSCITIEWFQRDKKHALEIITNKTPVVVRYGVYYFLIYGILLYGFNQAEFIYFQF
jgi:D-alanyl-lipoteichoic acid acyltransferase DltB (MBOAT superfamily)